MGVWVMSGHGSRLRMNEKGWREDLRDLQEEHGDGDPVADEIGGAAVEQGRR